MIQMVIHSHIQVNNGRLMRNITGGNECAPLRHMDRLGLGNPDITVKSAPGIPSG